MPAQRRPAQASSSAAGDGSPPPQATVDHQDQHEGINPPPNEHPDDSCGEGAGSPGSPGSETDNDEYMLVNLADLRKDVQCPICLGIIRKTRTVMECLHRFCRECIDKSMRLGNNECPACRTHCASRRSLRDDPNFDALIAALFPDIDKFEEEEFAFHEEEKIRNRKIQESIAETFQRQTEALGKKKFSAKATAAAFVRSQGNFGSSSLRSRGRSGGGETSAIGSDNDDEADENGNEGSKDSSADERSPELEQKGARRFLGPRSSPVRAAGNSNVSYEENEDLEASRENLGTSPLRVGHREMLVWGKGGARSQTRHGLNKNFKGGRMAKLVKHLRSLDENDDELDVHVTLLPMDEQYTPVLEQRYLCCRPTQSVRHLCEFIAIHTSAPVEQVEILVRKPQGGTSSVTSADSVDKAQNDPSEGLLILGPQESLSRLIISFASIQGDLVLLYRLKNAKLDESTS